jgi:hypothetical protein
MGTRLKKTGVYVYYSLVLSAIGLVTYFLPLRKDSGYTLTGRNVNVGSISGVNTALADVPPPVVGDSGDVAGDTDDCDDTDDCSPDAGSGS